MRRDIEFKYTQILSSRLQLYKLKKTRPFLATFRCPLCNDSQKNKRKTRGYIYEHKSGTFFKVKCHNCNYGPVPLRNFIERLDPELLREYNMENFLAEKGTTTVDAPVQNSVVKANVSLKGLVKISSLSNEHPAKKYVLDREIPANTHYKLFFTPHFSKWVNEKIPGKLYDKQKVDPRLVLPLMDRNGKVFAVQGRDLTGTSDQRYITIKFDDIMPKVYGLEDFKPNYKSYVVEGPIDSRFLPNCLAMTGSDVSVKQLIEVSNAQPDNLVFVFDNEPRNVQIVNRIEKTIDDGYNVCIWPTFIKPKDINLMHLAGLDPKKIIDDHTYNGMKAKLELADWRKC